MKDIDDIIEERLIFLGFAVTAHADFLKCLRSYGDLKHNISFDDSLQTLSQPFSDKFIARGNYDAHFPADPCGEKDAELRGMRSRTVVKGTQSYLADLNTKIRDPDAQLFCLDLQNSGVYGDQNRVSLSLESIPEDRFDAVSFLTRKPDMVGYDVLCRQGPNAITIFGDAKPFIGTDYPFSEQQVGQILDMAFEFLRQVQPWRYFLIVFLTDTRRWQFFKVFRNSGKRSGFEILESSILIDAAGWATYIALLCSQPHTLGYSDKSIEGVTDLQLIGNGKTYVFKGTLSSGEIAVFKVFPIDCKREFITERDNLAALKRLSTWKAHVPSLVDMVFPSSYGDLFALSPLGDPVQPCKDGRTVFGEHIVQLVGIVEEVHTRLFLAHRDIKPSNILLKEDGNLMLIDWGSAAAIGGLEVRYEGTVGFYDAPLHRDSHVPSAEADLLAVVRSAYSMLYNEMPPSRPERVQSFWNARLKTQIWLTALEACHRCDYKVLATEISKIK